MGRITLDMIRKVRAAPTARTQQLGIGQSRVLMVRADTEFCDMLYMSAGRQSLMKLTALQRAEHNEGMIASLEELALHQQHIETIELLNKVCRKLKILLLQNNVIQKIQGLHRLKDLQYLNLALNNVTKVQNLQRCESLTKLDLTMNFVSKAAILTVASLQSNEHLLELYLLGNPCSDWQGYRQYVITVLPALHKLDGQAIKPSERIQARQV
jgi:protein TilB